MKWTFIWPDGVIGLSSSGSLEGVSEGVLAHQHFDYCQSARYQLFRLLVKLDLLEVSLGSILAQPSTKI